jgi:hypothetical protein
VQREPQLSKKRLCIPAQVRLPTGAKVLALVGAAHARVLLQAVLVLVPALVRCRVVALAEVAALHDRALFLRPLKEVALVVVVLAPLGVRSHAVVILLLACILAGIWYLRASVGSAILGVRVGEDLEGEVLPIRKNVIASADWHVDAADRLSGTIAPHGIAGLAADRRRRRHTAGLASRAGPRAARRRRRRRLARVGGGGGDGRLAALGGTLLEAVGLATRAVDTGLARAGAVLINGVAPCGIFPAGDRAGESSILEAGADLQLAAGVSLRAACTLIKIGELVIAPTAAAIFTLGWDGISCSADRACGGGRSLRSRCARRG